mmetsp:Transcript_24940/g.40023  ORF Transcript_24940/g.40023 Transcript_24940/m.40023 type:complete len:314 (-) Transcript_24940:458-1399(-)
MYQWSRAGARPCLHLPGEHGVRGARRDFTRLAHLAGEVGHAVRLLGELVLARLNALAQPVVDFQAGHHLISAVPSRTARHGEDDALGDAVGVSVGAHSRGEPVALARGGDECLDGVSDGHGGRGGGGAAPLLDEQSPAGLDGRGEIFLEPSQVFDHIRGALATNLGVDKVRHLRGAMVAPDSDVGDCFVEDASLERQLALGAVFVQTSQRVEVLAAQVGCVLHRDQRVGVARVAHHAHLALGAGHFVERLALAYEDLAVHFQKVRTFHAGSAGLGANKQRPIRFRKNQHGVDADVHLAEQREEGVLKLHGDAL